MLNLAIEELRLQGAVLEDYGGLCGDLCDNVLHRHRDAAILYIAAVCEADSIIAACGDMWDYHMVPVVDGIVHDAWHPELMLPPEEYLGRAFPAQELRADIITSTKTQRLEI